MKKTESLSYNALIYYELDNPINRLLFPELKPSKVFPDMLYGTVEKNLYQEHHILLSKDCLEDLFNKSKKLGTLQQTFCKIPFKRRRKSFLSTGDLFFSGIYGHFIANPSEVIEIFLTENDQVLDTTVDELIKFLSEAK